MTIRGLVWINTRNISVNFCVISIDALFILCTVQLIYTLSYRRADTIH